MSKPAYLATFVGTLALVAGAADLSSSGDWSENIGAADLVSGAGSEVTAQYTSAASATLQDIANTSGDAWTLKARKADDTWHGGLTVWVRRASDGSGAGSIAGGTDYVALSGVDAVIYSGTGDRNSIALQYKLTGMSRNVSPNNYSTSIIFTVE